MTNSLVAPVGNTTSWYTGTGILDNAMSCKDAIEDGNWGEGLAQGAVGALGTLGAIADPLAAVLSAGVGWVLEHCKPFREALDKLAGQPDVIASFSATWNNVSRALHQSADELKRAVAADTAQWQSTAIDAYRTMANGQAMMIKAAGVAATGVGAAVTMGGVVVATVRATVRDLISEAVGNIISKALQALTVVLIPKVVPEIIALVAKWSVRIANWLRKVVQIISKLAALCKRLKPVFDKADELNRLLQDKFDGALSRVPGLRSPHLNPRTHDLPFLPTRPGEAPPNFTQYPRNTLANNTATETTKEADQHY